MGKISKPIVLYVSGNLAAKTMGLVCALARLRWPGRVLVITDGYVPEPVEGLGSARRVRPAEAERFIRDAALLVTSIRTPGADERLLLRTAAAHGVPSLAVLADLGSGARKFRDEQGWALPDRLAVADPVTHRLMVQDGVPPEVLVQAGSPYLDTMLSQARPAPRPRSRGDRTRICFSGVPNDSDFTIWGRNPHYTEADVMEGLTRVVDRLPGVHLTVRLHPKEFEEHPYAPYAGPRVTIQPPDGRCPLEQDLLSHAVNVSTYSTTLLVARVFGQPAISFQPPPGPVVRSDLYEAYGIPVAQTEGELFTHLSRAVEGLQGRGSLRGFLYNEGKGLEVIGQTMAALLDGGGRSGAGRRSAHGALHPLPGSLRA
ncbi:MAG TPA: hypothetical protein VHG51_13090 [Longimicrobiaceae bacterium]|nr:hypothetical protein [Longimicrobiaceae bacterium]